LRVDRALQGHVAFDAKSERRRYHDNAFTVFDARSPVGGFAAAEEAFARAFFNKERLDYVSLPTAQSLGPEPFMRLVPMTST